MDESKTYTVCVYIDRNAPQSLAAPELGALLPAFQWASPKQPEGWEGVDGAPALRGGLDKAQLYVIDPDRVLPPGVTIVVQWADGKSPFPKGGPAPVLSYINKDANAPGILPPRQPQTWVSEPAVVVNCEAETQRYSFTLDVAGANDDYFLDPEMEVKPGG